MLYLMKDIVI